MKAKKNRNGWSLRFGGVNGEAAMLLIQWIGGKGMRITICFNTNTLIRVFGKNQYIFGA